MDIRVWIVGTPRGSGRLDGDDVFDVAVHVESLQVTLGLRDLPGDAEAAAEAAWRDIGGDTVLVVLSRSGAYLVRPSGERIEVPGIASNELAGPALETLKRFCHEQGCMLTTEEEMRLPVGGYRLSDVGVGKGKSRGPRGWVDQGRVRFVIGKGTDPSTGRFFGIWDRQHPEAPLERFPPTEDGAVAAVAAYEALLGHGPGPSDA